MTNGSEHRFRAHLSRCAADPPASEMATRYVEINYDYFFPLGNRFIRSAYSMIADMIYFFRVLPKYACRAVIRTPTDPPLSQNVVNTSVLHIRHQWPSFSLFLRRIL